MNGALAKALWDYGPWAVVALQAGWIAVMWRALLKSHDRTVSMAERVLPLVEELRTAIRLVAQRGRP